jgi:hypothetical protein
MDITKLPKLQGTSNYDLWSIRIEALLTEKDYIDVMMTSISSQNAESLQITDIDYNNLVIKSKKACALVRLTLGDGPLLQTRHISDSAILWTTLKDLYSQQGFSSEFISCKELINTTLISCKGNMETYLHQIRRIINTLESSNVKLPEKFIISLLLNNLSQEYDYVVAIITQTIRSTSVLNIDNIFSQLLDESKRLGNNTSRKPNNTTKESNDIEMTLATSNSNKGNKTKCSYCKKPYHTEDKCWIKHP